MKTDWEKSMPMSDIITVPCLLIPIEGGMLLLPNAAVAEITGFHNPEPLTDSPEWLMGLLPWREHRLPLLSFEELIGRQVSSRAGRIRIAIINTLNGNKDLPFFGIVTQGIPNLIQVNQSILINSADDIDSGPGVLRSVLVNGHPAIIPDMDAIENLLCELPKESLGGFNTGQETEEK